VALLLLLVLAAHQLELGMQVLEQVVGLDDGLRASITSLRSR
jgi:hypothetical protein